MPPVPPAPASPLLDEELEEVEELDPLLVVPGFSSSSPHPTIATLASAAQSKTNARLFILVVSWMLGQTKLRQLGHAKEALRRERIIALSACMSEAYAPVVLRHRDVVVGGFRRRWLGPTMKGPCRITHLRLTFGMWGSSRARIFERSRLPRAA